jgi:hypothetical protein
MEKKIRVRYGRVNNQPKNTLVTICDGETIYFGISRCRMNEDRVNKEEGKRLALFRAEIAASNVAGAWAKDGTLFVHKTGVFGNVKKDDVRKLLEYFDNIDEFAVENLHHG